MRKTHLIPATMNRYEGFVSDINNFIERVTNDGGYVIKIHYSTSATTHDVYYSALIEYGKDEPVGTGSFSVQD